MLESYSQNSFRGLSEFRTVGHDDLSQRAASPNGEALVRRAKRDPAAFMEIYEAHYSSVAGYIFRRVGDRSVADDLAADVFLSALQAIGRFRFRSVPIRAWLYRIAHNSVINWSKKRKHLLESELGGSISLNVAPAMADAESTPAGVAELRLAMLTLSAHHQAVLSLTYCEGMTIREIAEVTGWRVGTVASRLARGRDLLREKMLGEGEDHGS